MLLGDASVRSKKMATPGEKSFCVLEYHFLEKMQFSDEVTFYVTDAVNHRNVRIWGSENPHAYVEHQHDSPKVNVFCANSSQKVYGPFFFAEETVLGMTYLHMLQLWLMINP